jgi:hypothetical protein
MAVRIGVVGFNTLMANFRTAIIGFRGVMANVRILLTGFKSSMAIRILGLGFN